MTNRLIGEIRREFEEIDRQLLELLAERVRLSRAMASLKKESGMIIVQPEVWRLQIQHRLEENETLGVDEGFVRNIFGLIHEESVRIQKKESENAANKIN